MREVGGFFGRLVKVSLMLFICFLAFFRFGRDRFSFFSEMGGMLVGEIFENRKSRFKKWFL